MHPKLIAYNYFANYFDWPTLNTLQDVVNNPHIERRPKLSSQAFLVKDLSLIGSLYGVQNEKYGVKIANGVITDFYILKPDDVNKGDITYVAYDTNTKESIEYYRQNTRTETKYDFKTDQLKQTNYFSTYDNLPDNIKSAAKDFKYKKYIFIYAEKPYGTIIECGYN
jgi:hypothetical protein